MREVVGADVKKIMTLALLPAAALALAAPAHADNDSNFGSGVNAANNWNFSAAAVCFQELAVVPVGGAWSGNAVNHCANGNVLNPAG
ncbi:hypothetical protein H4687_004911 [Streptomyces stelliscabiei]|uniref:Secreted protein n=2 Tax=Streptomyces stelliscabiei TaxID=146820 RepID=A0A8I0P768_9ACTN|nr:hypothetical protein [Streptomyces stelliscabiei]